MPASGVHLDTLGKIVGELRGDRTDAVYAAAIRIRILSNVSDGTPDALLKIAGVLLQDPQYADYAKACTISGIGALSIVDLLQAALKRADPAGVGMGLVVGPSNAWIMGSDSDATVGNGMAGVGDTTPVMGTGRA